MLRTLFEWLYGSLQSTPLFALLGSFIWGILSIVLSPCHLSSIPLIVGFINGQGKISHKRAFLISLLFAVGILITIAIIGIITAGAGRMMGDVGRYGNYFVALIFFIVGFHLVGLIPINWSGPGAINMKRRGLFAAFILGLVFGIALGPCTFAYMAPMLSITLNLSAANAAYGVVLLIAYGFGHCSVIVFAGTFTRVIQSYLDWNEQSKGSIMLKNVCGILVFLGGIYLVYITL